MRLADFQRRMELQRAQTAAKLLQLWSVVWLQRLVRRRLVERSRLAAGEVAPVREPGASAGLQEAKADASEECVAPEGNAATIRAGAVAAPKPKVGSGASFDQTLRRKGGGIIFLQLEHMRGPLYIDSSRSE